MSHNSDINEIVDLIDGLREKIDEECSHVDGHVDEVKSDVSDHNVRLTAHDSEIGELQNFADKDDARITELEREVRQLRTQLARQRYA